MRVRFPLLAPDFFVKEIQHMSNEVRKLSLQNRIKLLSERGSHNANIVKKLERQLRRLEAKD